MRPFPLDGYVAISIYTFLYQRWKRQELNSSSSYFHGILQDGKLLGLLLSREELAGNNVARACIGIYGFCDYNND